MTSSTAPIRSDRVRQIDGSFTFVPSRFLHGGFLATLSHAETALYLFLLLASNRQGVSRWHYDRICKTIGMDGDTYIRARNGLVEKDLVAFDGTRFQVLALPSRPLAGASPVSSNEKATATADKDDRHDQHASMQRIREILATLGD